MSATIDHLRVDHRVTVLRDFTDATGITLRAGETGILRGLSFDQIRREIHIDLECESGKVGLTFLLKAETGPRNGHMREYFEMGEDVSVPRIIAAFRDPSDRTMIVPPPQDRSMEPCHSSWSRAAQDINGPDQLKDVEEAMRKAIAHIGVAASIAEMYAQRMRMFQRAGNKPRAIAAFRLALDWMGTYASWATSGGEGVALSYERDRFHAALVREFGYDPARDNS